MRPTTSRGCDSWVLAAPFRAHVRDLVEGTGLPWRAVAVALDVPSGVLKALMFPRPGTRRIRHRDAAGLLAVTPDRLNSRGRMLVSASATTSAVRALGRLGFDDATVAEFLGCDAAAVGVLRQGRWLVCPWAWQWRAMAACEAHGLLSRESGSVRWQDESLTGHGPADDRALAAAA